MTKAILAVLSLVFMAILGAEPQRPAESVARVVPLHHDANFQTPGSPYRGALRQMTHPDTLWVADSGGVTTGPARARASRLASTQTFTPPFSFGGELVVHHRMAEVVYANGFVPGWDWRITFNPVYLDSDNLVALTIGGDGSLGPRFGGTVKARGVYAGCWSSRLAGHAELRIGARHEYEFRVPRHGVYEVWWDGQLVDRFVECSPTFSGAVHVGYRLDFHHVTLYNSHVRVEGRS